MADSDAPPLPSVLALLRRSPWPFVGWTLLIGLGVTTVWIFGAGSLLMWVGSSGLLHHTIRTAGYPDAKPLLYPGLLSIVLASMIAAASFVGLAFAPTMAIAIAGTLAVAGVAVIGAALAPLALAPIAAAAGTRGAAGPIARAIDLAGADRLHVFAPLCAVIAVGLLIPIPGTLAALVWALQRPAEHVGAGLGVACAAVLFWMAWVPVSAATLTLRYLRHQQRNDAPTRIAEAMKPTLMATAIGVLVLAVCAGAAIARPGYVRYGTPPSGLEFPVERDTGDSAYRRNAFFAGARALGFVMGPELRACSGLSQADGSVVVVCDGPEGRVWTLVDENEELVPNGIADRVHPGPLTLSALALALLALALALAWLGRIGASLRLLSSPRFEYAGELRLDGSDVVFSSSDGAHVVRAPRARIDHTQAHELAESDRATLLSNEPLAPMSFREAHAALPTDALLVIGPREDALARRIVRAREIGFRLGVVTLASLVVAAVAILFHA